MTRSRGELLADVFAEIDKYWKDNIVQNSTVTDEATYQELSLPSDARTRLCLFSLPTSLISSYKHAIFPLAEQEGLAPATVAEVVGPGSNVLATFSALLARCEIFVIDVGEGGPNAWSEIASARTRGPRPPRIAVVLPTEVAMPSSLVAGLPNFARLIHRPVDFTQDSRFINEIAAFLRDAAVELGSELGDEPMRLLQKKEYRAAVISAFSLLEAAAWPLLQAERGARKTGDFDSLTRALLDRGMISRDSATRLREWRAIRNRVVHSKEGVTPSTAKTIVVSVREITKAVRHRPPD